MKISAQKSKLEGSVLMPASKSHTIRAVVIGSLADGISTIRNPLKAADPLASVHICGKLGAEISGQILHFVQNDLPSPCHSERSEESGRARNCDWVVRGVGGHPVVPDDVLDTGNSGTTLYLTMGTASLVDGYSVFTGDEQIRSRPAGPLLEALSGLGVEAFSTRGNGKPPLVVRGPIRGGSIELDGSKTSQYLSALLLNCALAQGDTTIRVHNQVELPFIEMTLGWLDAQGIRYERDGFERFSIPGGQAYHAFDRQIPGDFSSAAFFLCAAAITGSELTLLGLDMNDSQGDKAIVEMLQSMGAKIEVLPEGIQITGGKLTGGEFDLAGTPDALPAMAVTACFAEGETRLVNVAQARLKETDRITVMCGELLAMGARIEELPDGLVIHGSELHSASVRGHGDHRVVMALAVAGMACDGTTEIDTAEAVSITFPTFVELMHGVGATMRTDGVQEDG